MSIRRGLLGLSLVLVVGLAAAYAVLFVQDPIPASSGVSIDWLRVRALAGPLNEGPRSIQSDVVARGSFYGWMICGGCGWDEVAMEFRSYQLVYANGESVVIDAVHDAERHASMPMMRGYDDRAFARQSEALRRADRILLTHEHWDRANGLRAVIGEPAVRERMWIPEAQRRSAAMRESGLTEVELAGLPPVGSETSVGDVHAIAPGLLPAVQGELASGTL